MLSSFLATFDLLKRIEERVSTSCVVTAAVKTEDLTQSFCIRITNTEFGFSVQKIFDRVELICEMEITEDEYIECLVNEINETLSKELSNYMSSGSSLLNDSGIASA